MFIRWKGKYAYLEQRYLGNGGKVKSKARYLGKNPLEVLKEMLAMGQIEQKEYEKIVQCELDGILKPTADGSFGITGGPFGLHKNTKISLFFHDQWLDGHVAKDDHGWYLADNSGNLLGLRPGMRVRILT
ncbi:hypothetical protein EG832_04335 [bacterium]|nr:hypothetical protein [bacterium]